MSDHNPSAGDPFGQIADEFVEATRAGNRPSVEEFAQRYPEHADQIREMLPALELMEKAKTADDTAGQRRQGHAGAAVIQLRQLGDYQILREVGRGGMGVVYEAQQLSLGRHVAIKVLPAHALLDPRHLGRFQREARSAAKLHHTNIVPVFGVGEQDGLHYYVMQFIAGLGLDVVLHELRRLRQPRGQHAPTQGDTPGRPTNVTRDISAGDAARSLLTGEFRPSEPTGALTLAPGEPAAEKDEGGRWKVEGRKQDASASSFILHPSSFSSAPIHLPGQKEASTLSESGSQYWQSVARIGVQVADALAHASSQGVLHRDIKPSNLLLDDTGNVWVTDFGLAKAASDSADLTHTGDVVGTLRYMAPERFNGQGDLRSDVYSLGLTLYELLTLRPAFDETDRNRLVRQVMHDEPVRPRKIHLGVPRDLETVVLKAIARDPAHRYQTPADMAEDLKRFVEDRPVRARRISNAEKLWRWCRRNPALAALATSTALLLLTVAIVTTTAYVKTSAALDEVDRERRVAQEAKTKAVEERDAANRHLFRSLVGEARALRSARGEGYREQVVSRLRQARQLDTPDEDLGQLRKEAVLSLGDWVGQAPRHLADFHVEGGIRGRAIHPSGALAAFGGGDGTLILRQLPGDLEVARWRAHREPLSYSAFTSDGQRLYSADARGELRTWEVDASGRWGMRPRSARSPTRTWAFDPDHHLAAGFYGLSVRFVDMPTGNEVGRFERPEAATVTSAAFSVDGKQLAVSCTARGESSPRVQMWDVSKRQLRHRSLPIPLGLNNGPMIFSPDGELLAVTPDDQGVIVFDLGDGRPRALFRSDSVHDVAFTPDSHFVIFTTISGLVIIGDVTGRTGVPLLQLPGGGRAGNVLALTPDGRSLVTAGRDGASLRELTVPEKLVLAGHGGGVPTVAISPDGTLLASGSKDRTVVFWDTATGRRLRTLPPFREFVQAVAFSPNGRWLVTGNWGSGIKVWDVTTLRQVAAPAHRLGPDIFAVQFSGDGKYLAATGNGFQVWRLQPKADTFALEPMTFQPGSRCLFLQASADGRWLAWVHADYTPRLWDLEEQRERPFPATPLFLGWHNLALHPESRWLAYVSRNRQAEFWSLDPPARAFALGEPGEFTAHHIASSPDGRWFAANPRTNAVTVWDTTRRQDRLDFPLESAAIWSLAFGLRGETLALGMSDGSLVIWRLARVRNFLEEQGLGKGR
jgi:serine/threonine protein kinase/WD40 repeat protein